MKRIGSIIAGGLVAMSALPALAQQAGGPGPGPGYGYGHMHMWGWHGGMIFHPLLGLLVLVAVIALLARAGGWGRHGYERRRPGGALDILEERFARGEIDKGEFEDRRKLLRR
ncbi:MAG TPA: SHOCT domain-containing protein [Stellaceae bacterium]|nr:SHOCT domain-containing protein [Stellaceae bacterium]